MPALAHDSHPGVELYLSQEESSEGRHEYVDGHVYAMAAENSVHQKLTFQLAALLQDHLGDGPWKTYLSDTKLRLKIGASDIFYYPDIMVAGDPRDTEDQYVSYPKLIIEVLSPSTARVDQVEKLQRCITCPTLQEFVLVSPDLAIITIHRRRGKWSGVEVGGPDEVLTLESVGLSLPLKKLYGARRFAAKKNVPHRNGSKPR